MGYVFGDHVLDPQRRELRRGGQLVPVEPKTLDVLLYLVRKRHRVVGGRELLDGVWQGSPVGEGAVARSIAGIRKALGDARDRQRVIRTYHGRGYRFVAEVVRASRTPEKDVRRPRLHRADATQRRPKGGSE